MIERLAAAGCVAPAAEAEQLLSAAPDRDTLDQWVRRREAGEPLAWIIGSIEFCGHTVHVDPGVYVPRHQTEELARRAAAVLPAGGRAVDLCTGSSAVAVHLAAAQPTATVIGVDIDIRAARCARRNGVTALVGDLGEPLAAAAFDVITAVAPYVPTTALPLLPADVQRYEPRRALDGGADGLDLVRMLIATAPRLLVPGGWLLLEAGGDQDDVLQSEYAARGYLHVTTWADDEGDLRGVAAQT